MWENFEIWLKSNWLWRRYLRTNWVSMMMRAIDCCICFYSLVLSSSLLSVSSISAVRSGRYGSILLADRCFGVWSFSSLTQTSNETKEQRKKEFSILRRLICWVIYFTPVVWVWSYSLVVERMKDLLFRGLCSTLLNPTRPRLLKRFTQFTPPQTNTPHHTHTTPIPHHHHHVISHKYIDHVTILALLHFLLVGRGFSLLHLLSVSDRFSRFLSTTHAGIGKSSHSSITTITIANQWGSIILIQWR